MKQTCGFGSLMAGLFLLVLPASVASAGVSFTPLGDLAGGAFESHATGVSDNAVVCGYGTTDTGDRAFRWSPEEGMVPLEHPPPPGPCSTQAWAISSNGAFVAGACASYDTDACYWRPTGELVTVPAHLGDDTLAQAWGISEGGAIVVGDVFGLGGYGAFLWTGSGAAQIFTEPIGGVHFMNARAVSDDGAVVVGDCSTPDGDGACRWTEATGPLPLDDFSAYPHSAGAFGVSGDGSAIVGSGADSAPTWPPEWWPFIWTEADGLVRLDALDTTSVAWACSDFGEVIVGGSYGAPVVWLEDRQPRLLADVLADGGVDLTGWELLDAADVCGHGTMIVGTAINPDGNQEAYLAVIPEPASGIVLLVGWVAMRCVFVAGLHRRRGR